MTTACVEPRPLYRPRVPQACNLWRLLDEYFDSFQQVYDERYQGTLSGQVRFLAAYLKCGDLQKGSE